MARLTDVIALDEAITHLEAVLSDESKEWNCVECKQEHEQLLAFLCELRERRAADNASTVDAVKVVRCKDCKHYKARYERCDHPKQEWIYTCADMWLEMKADDFCSYGEGKEERV